MWIDCLTSDYRGHFKDYEGTIIKIGHERQKHFKFALLPFIMNNVFDMINSLKSCDVETSKSRSPP